MALMACRECGGKVATSAESCPHCGAKVPRGTSPVTWVVAVVLGFALVSWMSRFGDTPSSPSRADSVAAPADPGSEARARWAVATRQAIRSSAHDPASIEWIEARVSDDAQIGCVAFRAKNALGATVLQKIGYASGRYDDSPAAQKTLCAQSAMQDMRDVTGVFRFYP